MKLKEIGISAISPDTILIVLAGHLHYFITDVLSAPVVRASSEAITLSLYSRRMCMDTGDIPLFSAPGTMDEKARLMTARTAAWEGLGEPGIVSWYGE